MFGSNCETGICQYCWHYPAVFQDQFGFMVTQQLDVQPCASPTVLKSVDSKDVRVRLRPRHHSIFVDEDRLSDLGLTLRDLAHFLESQPFIFAVFTNDDVRRAADALKPVTPTRRHLKYKV